MSLRIIKWANWGVSCFEDGELLLKQGIIGSVVDPQGVARIRRRGGFWNNEVYEFLGEAYDIRQAPEPRLKWRLGFTRWWPEKIESDGFSGVLQQEQVLKVTIFRLGTHEWRFDETLSQLTFSVFDPKAELRTSLVAFRLYKRCANSESGGSVELSLGG